jgi:hypothetical protein
MAGDGQRGVPVLVGVAGIADQVVVNVRLQGRGEILVNTQDVAGI